jgi:hypothetical protein
VKDGEKGIEILKKHRTQETRQINYREKEKSTHRCMNNHKCEVKKNSTQFDYRPTRK